MEGCIPLSSSVAAEYTMRLVVQQSTACLAPSLRASTLANTFLNPLIRPDLAAALASVHIHPMYLRS